ncbi:Cephalosporin hydroxylase [Halomonas sp. TD01]|nr:Cephalosporin hydroxylase [Halomonas sp. TD01]
MDREVKNSFVYRVKEISAMILEINMKSSDDNPFAQFLRESHDSISSYSSETEWNRQSNEWLVRAFDKRYMYNFQWMGRPIIQTPVDMAAIQELIWQIKPDLIIETGIAHGGSLMLSASMLALLDMCEAIETGAVLDPKQSKRKVLGIDIDIRAHNREAIEAHPMASRIEMIQGSSIAPEVIEQVQQIAEGYERVLVCLDSNHTHDHVLAELEAYAPLTSVGSYCVVFDTIVEDMPADMFPDRPWGPGNNPKTAVWKYLGMHSEFEIDKNIHNKLLITVAPDGYLKRVS